MNQIVYDLPEYFKSNFDSKEKDNCIPEEFTVDLGNYDNVLPPICYNSNSNGNLIEEIKQCPPKFNLAGWSVSGDNTGKTSLLQKSSNLDQDQLFNPIFKNFQSQQIQGAFEVIGQPKSEISKNNDSEDEGETINTATIHQQDISLKSRTIKRNQSNCFPTRKSARIVSNPNQFVKIMYSKQPDEEKPSCFKQKMIGVSLKQIVVWIQLNWEKQTFINQLHNSIPQLPNDFIEQMKQIKAIDSQKEQNYITSELGILMQRVVYRGTAKNMLAFMQNQYLRKLFLFAFEIILINGFYPQKITNQTSDMEIVHTQHDYFARLGEILTLASLYDPQNEEIPNYHALVNKKLQELEQCNNINGFAADVKQYIGKKSLNQRDHLIKRAVKNAKQTRRKNKAPAK